MEQKCLITFYLIFTIALSLSLTVHLFSAKTIADTLACLVDCTTNFQLNFPFEPKLRLHQIGAHFFPQHRQATLNNINMRMPLLKKKRNNFFLLFVLVYFADKKEMCMCVCLCAYALMFVYASRDTKTRIFVGIENVCLCGWKYVCVHYAI